MSPGKTGFTGEAAHYAAKGRERIRIFGVLLEGGVAAEAGDDVLAAGPSEEQLPVGVVTCGMVSSLTGRSMALARLAPQMAVQDTPLAVRGKAGVVPAIAHALPFDDPRKTKRTAVG